MDSMPFILSVLGNEHTCIHYQQLDVITEKIPLEDDCVDLVTMCLVLEHVPVQNLVHVLKEARRILRKRTLGGNSTDSGGTH